LSKIFKHLKLKTKIGFFNIFILNLSQIIGDLLAVGSIIPFTYFITNKDKFLQNDFIRNISTSIDIDLQNTEIVLQILIFLIITLFILKTFLFSFSIYYQTSFFRNLSIFFKEKLLNYYFSRDLIFITKNRKSSLIKNLETECSHFVEYFNIGISVITEIIILLCLIIFLFITNKSLVIIFSLGLLTIFLFYFYLVRKKFEKIGEDRKKFNENLLQSLQQIFNSFIEIKTFDKQKYFFNDFVSKNIRYENTLILKKILNVLPRYFIELIIVVLFFSTILFQMNFQPSNNNFVFELSIIILIVLRILPSYNKLLVLFQDMKFYRKSFLHIKQNIILSFEKAYYNNEEKITSWSKINLDKISIRYSENLILDKIKLIIQKKDKIFLSGPSGSGKSSLINTIIGLLTPESGHISIDNIVTKSLSSVLRVGYVPQQSFLLNESIDDNIGLGERDLDQEKLKKVKEICKINLSNFETISLRDKVGDNGAKLSGGQCQRVSIARSLYFLPEILILDEATSALDETSEQELISQILQEYEDLTILISSHNLKIKEKFKKSWIINNKNIFTE